MKEREEYRPTIRRMIIGHLKGGVPADYSPANPDTARFPRFARVTHTLFDAPIRKKNR